MNALNRCFFLSLFAALILIGCGGGGGGSDPAAAVSTLSGTAAVGAPIVAGTVNVTCAAGPTITGIPTTSTTGAWSVNVTGQTLPCAVQIMGGTINGSANTTAYQSFAINLGTVNVTPLTDLIVANLVGTTTPATWFAGLTGSQLSAISSTQVTTALNNLRTSLGLTALNTIDPVTLAFDPTNGVVMDDILTALAIAITSNATSYTALLNLAGTGSGFTTPAGFNTALSTAYASTTSGGGGTGTGGGGGGTGVTPSKSLVFTSSPFGIYKIDLSNANAATSISTDNLGKEIMGSPAQTKVAYTFGGATKILNVADGSVIHTEAGSVPLGWLDNDVLLIGVGTHLFYTSLATIDTANSNALTSVISFSNYSACMADGDGLSPDRTQLVLACRVNVNIEGELVVVNIAAQTQMAYPTTSVGLSWPPDWLNNGYIAWTRYNNGNLHHALASDITNTIVEETTVPATRVNPWPGGRVLALGTESAGPASRLISIPSGTRNDITWMDGVVTVKVSYDDTDILYGLGSKLYLNNGSNTSPQQIRNSGFGFGYYHSYSW